jgi:hypothetical protein
MGHFALHLISGLSFESGPYRRNSFLAVGTDRRPGRGGIATARSEKRNEAKCDLENDGSVSSHENALDCSEHGSNERRRQRSNPRTHAYLDRVIRHDRNHPPRQSEADDR